MLSTVSWLLIGFISSQLHTQSCTHTHAHLHIHAHTFLHAHSCTYTHEHAHMHTCTFTHLHYKPPIHTFRLILPHKCTHTHEHAHPSHAQIAHMHTHTHPHLNPPAGLFSPSLYSCLVNQKVPRIQTSFSFFTLLAFACWQEVVLLYYSILSNPLLRHVLSVNWVPGFVLERIKRTRCF